jgi:hypothetical protein
VTLEKLDGYHSQRLEKVRVPLRTCAMVAPLGVQHRRGPFRLVRRPRVRQRKIQRPPSRLPAARTGPSSLFAERRLRFLPCAHFGGRVGALMLAVSIAALHANKPDAHSFVSQRRCVGKRARNTGTRRPRHGPRKRPRCPRSCGMCPLPLTPLTHTHARARVRTHHCHHHTITIPLPYHNKTHARARRHTHVHTPARARAHVHLLSTFTAREELIYRFGKLNGFATTFAPASSPSPLASPISLARPDGDHLLPPSPIR